MISINVPTSKSKSRRFWRPLVVAVFSYRYDAHLVPDLLSNLEPLVDGWISWDDRASAQQFSSDGQRRHALMEAAHAVGAKWILAVDPDERFEAGVQSKIRNMVRVPGRFCWTFELKELYTIGDYRVDGVWGRKRQKRLFPIYDNQFPISERHSYPDTPLHGAWVPKSYQALHSRLNLYHLKMIEPARRLARSTLYTALDPEHRYQAIGYDYLADESGAVLEAIPPGRHYLPAHHEDNGLWMVEPSSIASNPDQFTGHL